MKTMKRFAGLLLALVMLLALATNAFAADPEATTGTITVTNPMNEQAYTAYKIFDVDYNSDKSAVTYTIGTDSEWYNVVKAYADQTDSGLTLQKVASDAGLFTVTISQSFSAADFSNHLKTNLAGKTGYTLARSEDGKTASVSGLSLGYYFVTSSTGALCNLTTTTPTAEIRDKNDVPFVKTADKTSVQVGETVSYTLTGKVPDTTGFEKYTYTISDTMTEGLTFQKDVAVTVNGTALATDKYTLTDKGNGFELTIFVKEIQTMVGQEIKVTYTAVTNEAAVAQISTNTAKLKYSNDPTKETFTEIDQTKNVYSAQIAIDKYDANDKTKKLSGAHFYLKNADGKYYKYTPATETAPVQPAKVEWVDTKKDATEAVTINGIADEFKGLADGTYFLEETKAPAGYNLLAEDFKIEINGRNATKETLTVTASVANSTGTTLPSTGGIGTTIFYILGALMVLGAAILLVVKKRMSLSK